MVFGPESARCHDLWHQDDHTYGATSSRVARLARSRIVFLVYSAQSCGHVAEHHHDRATYVPPREVVVSLRRCGDAMPGKHESRGHRPGARLGKRAQLVAEGEVEELLVLT